MARRFRLHRPLLVLAALAASACAHSGSAKPIAPASVAPARLDVIRHAQVWSGGDVSSKDLKAGPRVPGAFAYGQTVDCRYVNQQSDGASPKFYCEVAPGDVVKVKYGSDNGEVYGEVAATRLLWALGFPADAMYPVRVRCHGCSADPFRNPHGRGGDIQLFDSAVIEREFPGKALQPGNKRGWAWPELDLIDEKAGGAPLAQRDALKLLAIFIQHTDAKPQQQRLTCPKDATRAGGATACAHPIAMISDLGLTFGHANKRNEQSTGSVNLRAWMSMPVWRDSKSCVGNMPKSYTGTLGNPAISEAGRSLLANLLMQLSDKQLRDLFETAGMPKREGASTGSVTQWVAAFKDKRDQVVTHSCAS